MRLGLLINYRLRPKMRPRVRCEQEKWLGLEEEKRATGQVKKSHKYN